MDALCSFTKEAALVGEDFELWEDVQLLVEDGRIVRIERAAPRRSGGADGGALPEEPETATRGADGAPCEVIDLRGALLLPGFVNTHCHLPMTLFRGLGGGLPLQRWLSEVIFPLERELTGEDVALGARLALAEMIRGGTTAFADMYYFSPRIVEETLAAGLRGDIGRSVCSFDLRRPALSFANITARGTAASAATTRFTRSRPALPPLSRAPSPMRRRTGRGCSFISRRRSAR